MGWIYRFTSPSGKSYIGQTIQDIHKRFKDHHKSSSNCTLLKRAIDKYGDQMKFEILEEALDSSLDDREIYWIKQLNTLAPHGYNCSTGGNSNKKLSDQLKNNISKRIEEKLILSRGYAGCVKKRGNGFVPIVQKNNKTLHLSNGAYSTFEEARDVLKLYSKDPENFKIIDLNKQKVGCIHYYKSRNKWVVYYKKKYLGIFPTKEEAENCLKVHVDK